MDAKLYMVSLGPGERDLITLKALRALQEADAICVPTKSVDRSFAKSLTYSIVKDLMDEYGFEKPILPVYAPMQFRDEDWEAQVDVLEAALRRYGKIAFVTLGDAAIYSTVYYLLDIIKKRDLSLYEASEVVAGVTSFSQASARVKKPLCVGESALEIVPLLGKDVPKTTIYMRPKIGMDTKAIQEKGEIYTFENLNFSQEKIYPQKIAKTKKYMTLFIDFFKPQS